MGFHDLSTVIFNFNYTEAQQPFTGVIIIIILWYDGMNGWDIIYWSHIAQSLRGTYYNQWLFNPHSDIKSSNKSQSTVRINVFLMYIVCH